MACVEIEQHNRLDEVKTYQTGRFLNCNEAMWRLFGQPIHERYPAVMQLAVHLENGQRVYYRPGQERIIAEAPSDTTLTAFFKLCQTDAFARTLLYAEVPTYYTFSDSSKRWSRRVRGKRRVPGWEGVKGCDTIGRVYTVHPNHGDCFYLRVLLISVRGPTSFGFLKRVDGYDCQTYREACQLRGLLENDSEWRSALAEGALSRKPPILRGLFAVILCRCSPANPAQLWNEFKNDLSEDILNEQRRTRNNRDLAYGHAIYNRALILIEDLCLRIESKCLSDLGLSAPDRDYVDSVNSEIDRERRYDTNDLQNYVSSNLPLLNNDQRTVFNSIVGLIEERDDNRYGKQIFLDAPGGTGKTFLINLILAYFRSRGHIINAVASTGIAATLMAGGRTAHSTFNLPLKSIGVENPVCNLKRGTAKATMLAESKAIIWDECTMANKGSLEALDRSLKDIRRDLRPFGNMIIILSGDFRQTLPVIKRGTPADVMNACLKRSPLWRLFTTMHLRVNMRARRIGSESARIFSKLILDVGNGVYPCNDLGTIELTSQLCRVVRSEDELIECVFPDILSNYRNADWLEKRAILAPRNDTVNALNHRIQQKLIDSRTRFYYSSDHVINTDLACTYPTEFLYSLSPDGFPPHELQLKIGSPIILLRNLQPPILCNGTRLIVLELQNRVIKAKILSGPFKGEIVLIPRIPLITSELVVEFKRVQFPVRLAFAITINKSQGQSFDIAGVHLQQPCFSHGQAYVAFSRVRTPSNLFVFSEDGRTKNIVYRQVLS